MHGAAVVIAVAATCALTAGAAAACSATTGTRKPPAAATAAARAVHGPHFYVSLGDSLSQGVQPDATGGSAATRQGYPDQLYAVLRRGAAGLRLVKLGCSGETTSTMIHGGTCHYPAGSQLAAADLPACPRSHISLITIDIGSSDPNSCIISTPAGKIATGAIPRCLNSSFRNTLGNLATILRRQLRAAR